MFLFKSLGSLVLLSFAIQGAHSLSIEDAGYIIASPYLNTTSSNTISQISSSIQSSQNTETSLEESKSTYKTSSSIQDTSSSESSTVTSSSDITTPTANAVVVESQPEFDITIPDEWSNFEMVGEADSNFEWENSISLTSDDEEIDDSQYSYSYGSDKFTISYGSDFTQAAAINAQGIKMDEATICTATFVITASPNGDMAKRDAKTITVYAVAELRNHLLPKNLPPKNLPPKKNQHQPPSSLP
ncbi:unnamed protein product [[Candida] boidinii]|uniref:Unnamed protein product n=1 Tax=Candida boidinii TaxID=5477 RepID=A0ACB5TLS1_CANBO|nr:unnamed protein product [[Candida] boidinii]